MKSILNGFTIGFTVFGAVLSLFMGLFSQAPFGVIAIRMLISAVVMGGIAIGIQLVVRNFIPEDQLQTLTGKKQDGGMPSSMMSENRLDITEDDGMSAEELYSANESSESGMGSDGDSDDYTMSREERDETERADEESDSEFHATNYSSEAPRVRQSESNSSGESGEVDYMKEERKRQMSASSSRMESGRESNGDVSFKSKDKKIIADPKIIAKAIKTVMSRE